MDCRSSDSSSWGLPDMSSSSSDGWTDPEVDPDDGREAAAFASHAQGPKEELYSRLQGLQQELQQNQNLQQALRMAEQSSGQNNCSGCSGYGQAPFTTPWKPLPVGVQQHQLQEHQFQQQQQQQIMQIHQELQQLERAVPTMMPAPPPQVQGRWRPFLGGEPVSPFRMDNAASSTEVSEPAKKKLIQPQTPDKPFYNEHGVDLMKLSNVELEKVVPLNASGQWTSIGALLHPDKCSPCIFWFRNVCEKGIRCEFCHFTHPGQIAKKIRPSKSVRLKQKDQERREAA